MSPVARCNDSGGTDAGAAYVIFGRPSGASNTAPNAAPVVTTTAGTTAFVEGAASSTPVVVDGALTLTDDGAALASATVAVTAGFVAGEDVLAFTATGATGNIAGSYDGVTGRLTLTSAGATATVTQFQAALRLVTYTDTSDTPSTGNRTISFTANDGSLASAAATRTVSVTAFDDAPVAVADPVSTPENAVLTGSLTANDTDVDGGPKAITAVNGVGAAVGAQITLASGARLTVQADGSYSYDPNGAFNYLVSAATAMATGATNTSATDSFTYSITGGAAATVTVTVNGIDGTADQLRGDGGNNTLNGTGAAEVFRLDGGGTDTVNAGGGDDQVNFLGTLDATDIARGGAGTDQLAIQGSYTFTFGPNITGFEQLAVLGGSVTRFGAPGNQLLTYNLTTTDDTVAAGVNFGINANELIAGENFTFDGSAELDGAFSIFTGLGIDTLTGGARSDAFYFGEGGRFTAADSVDGGGQAGSVGDQLTLRGDYSTQISFLATTATDIEMLVLLSAKDVRFGPEAPAYNYNIRTHDDTVAANRELAISANTLRADEGVTFDGSLELDGSFYFIGGMGIDVVTGGAQGDRLYGGGGADRFTGGGGGDSYIYLTADQSVTAARDQILDFATGDRIDLSLIDAIAGTPGTNDAFSFIGAADFTVGTPGQVRAYQSGTFWFVDADTDGNGVADLSIQVTSDHAIVVADLIL